MEVRGTAAVVSYVLMMSTMTIETKLLLTINLRWFESFGTSLHFTRTITSNIT